MPTYEYECPCGHRFEVFQNITEKPLRKCPACGKRRLRRLISAGAAVIFKGSGFYQTDYRSKEYKEKAKADKESTAKSSGEGKGSSTDTSSDTTKKTPSKKDE